MEVSKNNLIVSRPLTEHFKRRRRRAYNSSIIQKESYWSPIVHRQPFMIILSSIAQTKGLTTTRSVLTLPFHLYICFCFCCGFSPVFLFNFVNFFLLKVVLFFFSNSYLNWNSYCTYSKNITFTKIILILKHFSLLLVITEFILTDIPKISTVWLDQLCWFLRGKNAGAPRYHSRYLLSIHGH